MCLWPPRHLLPSWSARCEELGRNPVGFFTLPIPHESLEYMPYLHMWHTVLVSLNSSMNFTISGILHDVALFGCSCKNQPPCSIWIRYNLIANLMCLSPLSMSACHLAGSIRHLLSAWRALNAVHIGDPIKNFGFS